MCLTIAGSDSGGGAGIQADLKTFAAMGVFGTSAITCLTAQNPDGVLGITPTPRGFVAEQIRAVCSSFPVASAKTGMLYSSQLIREVVKELRRLNIPALVVDPVARATSGAPLLRPGGEKALLEELLPLASVVTPNVPEAEMILCSEIRDGHDQVDAARAIAKGFGVACILKGGHLPGAMMQDVLCASGKIYKVRAERVSSKETHGTGCTLAAAVAASLGKGMSVPGAFRNACGFVHEALRRPFKCGAHTPLGIHC